MAVTGARPSALGSLDQPTRVAMLQMQERVDSAAVTAAAATAAVKRSIGAGVPGGTGTVGQEYYDSTNLRLYLSDGTAWTVQPGSRVGGTWRRTTNLAVNNITLTAVTMTVEDTDPDGFGTATSSVFTVPAGLGGMYAVAGEVTYGVIALGANVLRLAFSTITDPYEFAGTGINGLQAATVTVPLAAGATITMSTYHTNGVAQNVARARLDIYRIGV